MIAKELKILVLTDHSTHSIHNSFYTLVNGFFRSDQVQYIDVASRQFEMNRSFFINPSKNLWVKRIKQPIVFEPQEAFWKEDFYIPEPEQYDVVVLRIPRPISDDYLMALEKFFDTQIIINKPSGIIKTGNKKFLTEFKNWTVPIKVCYSIEEVLAFSKSFPIVLKPLREYGGKGIIRINGNELEADGEVYNTHDYLPTLNNELNNSGMLAMQFLKNVSKGDKRIIVIGGNIIGASLRIPKPGQWLCNISQGGKAIQCELTADEQKMISSINPKLESEGILIYGVDTLEDDNGKRILSEINTLSVGGFQQAQQWFGPDIIDQSIQKIINYASHCFIG